MKQTILFFSLLLAVVTLKAQSLPIENLIGKNILGTPEELKVLYINQDVSTHFISNEDIKYVDISVNSVVGDLPSSNTLRVKPVNEGASAVITIVTERYFVQYLLVYTTDFAKATTRYNIPYADYRSYMNPETNVTKSEMYQIANKIFTANKSFHNVFVKKYSLQLSLNNICTFDKYFFIDISLINKSNIPYDIDHIKFKIEDRKQTKAANFQSVEISPIIELLGVKKFKKKYRNVFVFEKFTFPEQKVLTVEISEKQISGRTIILRINYSDILNADAII